MIRRHGGTRRIDIVAWSERLGKFGLELPGEKSGLVRFSRYALKDNGGFRFLGFLYHWTLSRNGKPKVQRMTDPKKLQASVAVFSEWIRSKRHQRAHRVMAQLKRKLSPGTGTTTG